jgi:hypothetical protein
VSFAVVVLVARLALVGVLHLFLFLVVRALYRDLRSVGRPAVARRPVRTTGIPHLTVLMAGKSRYTPGKMLRVRSPFVLGRDPSCEVTIEDDWVSGQHLRLVQTSAGWQAQDLNSTNGTRINGVRIRGTVLLKHGDVLDLGRFRVRFTLEN